MRFVRFVVLVGVLTVPLGFAATPVAKRAVAEPPRVQCELICSDGDGEHCAVGEHDAWNSDVYRDAMRRLGSHSISNPCWEGSCASEHDQGQCSIWTYMGEPIVTSGDVGRLKTAMADKDLKTVVALTAKHPHQITVNVERGLIQVVNCSGRIRASLPATEQFIKSVVGATSAH